MIVKVTVDELLEGSRIVANGEDGGIVYAVAVLKWHDITAQIDKKIKDVTNKAWDSVKTAQNGDRSASMKAEEELIKAIIYEKENMCIAGIKRRPQGLFEELEKEIRRLKEQLEQ
jgi:hypothetical protein